MNPQPDRRQYEANEEPPELTPPEWIGKAGRFKTASVSEFPQAKNPFFDPTAQPNTKRENPTVLTIGDYQVDLTRAAMLGYDIIFDANGEPLIAVLTSKWRASSTRRRSRRRQALP